MPRSIFDELDSLLSALTPSQYRKYYKEWKTHGDNLRKVYDELFKRRQRIGIRIKLDLTNYKKLLMSPKELAKSIHFSPAMENYAYLYFKDLGKDEEATAILHFQRDTAQYYREYQNDPKIFEFVPNYLLTGKYKCRTSDREISIGKILEYVRAHGLCEGKSYTSEEQLRRDTTIFNQRSAEAGKELIIILSRHPYDIAGMSTGRGWRSCMNIDDGEQRQFVMSSLMNGALIAYLCNRTDTDIQNPLGRVLIKPFYRKEDGSLNFAEPNFILKCSQVYGTFYNAAVKKVQSWLDENWNRFIDTDDGDFDLDDKAFYREKGEENIRGGRNDEVD